MKLTGKRALVTGSSAGLGQAIAEALAREGVTVVVHGRNEARAGAVADRIVAEGGRAEVAVGDLSTDQGAGAVADEALSGGTIDILVNNAGAYDQLGWTEATPEVWADTYQTNVLSGVRMIRSLVPRMRASGWGRVIQIGGGLAVQPKSAQPHYNASLAARHNLAVSLARELKGSGITSNTVAPGAILTEAVRDLLWQIAPAHGWGDTWEEIERAAAESWVPNDAGRFGRPEEIAPAVVYLASPLADYISGAMLRVDGGTVRCVG
ncbi:SDR family NAD(P)-dependent oxidoreductase [Streptomyces thermodiastaticus]|jgi:NAD(P)-dependent dehydrogenase (short-subunit alcohol dehydrogenase family)|uniref:SDR family NAD(P)-dependent oxidoreductase n=1 Tax=Streptomyces thermodiastaticus TaxID=44061 RepID=UPI001E393D5F|nr:SDR family NAD(P)-dependent oxidoreductase [Streptomyces thermodiastaticus]MCE7553279.1 SDR family NAD(P)-dependent oxidoreductase [Streptomyces thermodiastaticus]